MVNNLELVRVLLSISFYKYLQKLKLNIKNKAHLESSICNAYLVEEASVFCSYYFEDHV